MRHLRRSTWFLSQTETEKLRRAPDAPPDSTVYRREDLIAMVYSDPEGYWHLLLGVDGNTREPEIGELLEARAVLLHGIEHWEIRGGKFLIEAGKIASPPRWLPDVPCFHLKELRDEPHPRTTN